MERLLEYNLSFDTLTYYINVGYDDDLNIGLNILSLTGSELVPIFLACMWTIFNTCLLGL